MRAWHSIIGRWRWGIPILCAYACLLPAVQAKTDIKAAMVYNIIRFVEFPGARQTLNLCVVRSDPMAQYLAALEGRQVGGARLNIVTLESAARFGASCQIIYTDSGSAADIGPRVRGQITIGAGRQFAENGGTVGLIRFGGQTRFVINLRDADGRDVRFSSQLIQLAAKVIS